MRNHSLVNTHSVNTHPPPAPKTPKPLSFLHPSYSPQAPPTPSEDTLTTAAALADTRYTQEVVHLLVLDGVLQPQLSRNMELLPEAVVYVGPVSGAPAESVKKLVCLGGGVLGCIMGCVVCVMVCGVWGVSWGVCFRGIQDEEDLVVVSFVVVYDIVDKGLHVVFLLRCTIMTSPPHPHNTVHNHAPIHITPPHSPPPPPPHP